MIECVRNEAEDMASTNTSRGLIAVDKIGTKILFLNPVTFETEAVLDGFPRTVHELLVVPETAQQQRQANHPVQDDHQQREHRVAAQRRGGLGPQHHRRD